MTRYNPDLHHRRSIRLHEYDYSQAGLYFVTICTKEHICLLGDIVQGEMQLNDWGQIASECWCSIPQHYPHVVLHGYVIMPNHLHGILEIVEANNHSPQSQCTHLDGREDRAEDDRANNHSPLRPCGTSRTIGSIVRGFKIGVAKQIGTSIWQRNYHEHIIRDCSRHALIVDYINHNPMRWAEDKLNINI